jgi:hypothetical protein
MDVGQKLISPHFYIIINYHSTIGTTKEAGPTEAGLSIHIECFSPIELLCSA